MTPEPQRSNLLAAAEQSAKARKVPQVADTQLRAAVRAANAAGGSVRDIAGLLGKSTNTIQRWLRED